MSKTTVRKSLEGFEAAELRQLILDLYSKSKEAKELLDFYAQPDLRKKIEEYQKPILKEVWRYTRHAYHPRMPRIRSALKKFRILEPGDEAVAELMAFTMLELAEVGGKQAFSESTENAIEKFYGECLEFIKSRMLLDEYGPRLQKSVREMADFRYYHNTLKRRLAALLAETIPSEA